MSHSTSSGKAKQPPASQSANPMWGGHYAAGPAAIMEKINASIDIDKRLYSQDIRGSIAHSKMLAKQGIIEAADQQEIEKGLNVILAEIEAGNFTFTNALEDIHMHVEARLSELIGDAAGRLHTARSRNDQVATDFRLFVRDAVDSVDAQLRDLLDALLTRAEEYADTVMPGFTHLQTAQPVTLGHHLMAYVEMFARDRSRFNDARARLNESPLGACALAGTSFPLDREMTAKALGFDRAMGNSLDAVSDRDFALEFLSAASICSVHLSRLAEEFIIWATSLVKFITLSDKFTTGSSIMPQKRNPDAAELVRGKSGAIFASLTSLLVMLKGLPLAYNKDMQEDKEPLFKAFDNLTLCLAATAGMVRDFTANAERMRAMAGEGFSTATDIADWLVRTLKIPFRKAHHITGRIVRIGEEQGKRLEELSLAEMQSVEPGITQDIFNVLSVESSVKSRTSFGGTAPVRVREAIAKARKAL